MENTNEIKVLEYLDFIVRYEHEKNKVIEELPAPMDITNLITSVDRFEENKLSSTQACIRKMIANKVLKNLILRRSFEIFVREGFDDIDFLALSKNARYFALKNKILKKYPDMCGMDNKDFLKKIANSIAHGNYIELLKIEDLERRWKVGDKDIPLNDLYLGEGSFSLGNLYSLENISDYDTNSHDALKKMNSLSPMVDITPLQMYMTLLEGNPYNNGETLGLRIDGLAGKKKGKDTCNIELSNGEIDEILFFLIANSKNKKRLTLESKQDIPSITIPKGNTPEADFNKILEINNLCVYNTQTATSSEIQLDDHQMEYFKNEYLRCRELFTPKYYEDICGSKLVADMLSTNNHSELLGLSNMLVETGIEKLSYQNYLLSTNLRNYLAYVCACPTPKNVSSYQQLFANESRRTYGILQIYDTYTEALITETLLLLQIVEDRDLYHLLEENKRLLQIINNMDMSALEHFRSSTKYGNDEMSLLKHLRNSLTHMKYLKNHDGNIFVYDRVSRKNKKLDYKFSLNIEDLKTIKDELFFTVAGHYPNFDFGNENILY